MSDAESREKEAWNEFYLIYGAAMVAWSRVERELGTLFATVTGMKPDLAMRVFYSARSFQGRVDMFESAVTDSEIEDAVRNILKQALKRAGQYNSVRNIMAHDLPQRDFRDGPNFGQVVLIGPKGMFQKDDVKAKYVDRAITLDDLREVTENFNRLASVIEMLWAVFPIKRASSHGKYLELVLELPTSPYSKTGRKDAKSPRPPRSSPG